eukprot:1175710-Prorocentrum_minimum.AAC.1
MLSVTCYPSVAIRQRLSVSGYPSVAIFQMLSVSGYPSAESPSVAIRQMLSVTCYPSVAIRQWHKGTLSARIGESGESVWSGGRGQCMKQAG